MRTPEQLRRDADALYSRANHLRDEAEKLERKNATSIAESAARVGAAVRQKLDKILPVDRSRRTLTDGSPVTDDHREIDPKTGMQKGYVVLSDEERAKGFIRPVRQSYKHETCGATTTMGLALSETYARDPYFYSGTFCATCRAHFPVGLTGEFVWAGTNIKVGT